MFDVGINSLDPYAKVLAQTEAQSADVYVTFRTDVRPARPGDRIFTLTENTFKLNERVWAARREIHAET
jgi:hypothetical protein